MRLDWILMAEGFGTNAAGALTVISVNQNAFTPASLPVFTKRGVLAHFVAEAEEAAELTGKEISVTAQAEGPSGEVISAFTVTGVFPARPWPDVPGGLDVIIEFPLRISSYGTYTLRVSTRQASGEAIEGKTDLYVREPVALDDAG